MRETGATRHTSGREEKRAHEGDGSDKAHERSGGKEGA